MVMEAGLLWGKGGASVLMSGFQPMRQIAVKDVLHPQHILAIQITQLLRDGGRQPGQGPGIARATVLFGLRIHDDIEPPAECRS